MVEPGFVVFKYQHGDPLVRSWVVWVVFWSLLALFAASIFVLGPFGIVLTLVGAGLIASKWPKRQINLGPRYLVCGNTLAYYKNVQRMAMRPGHLVLFWGNNQSFKLEQQRFPTNARKQHKISANKAQKFAKVSYRIIERVLAESPKVELVGIDRKTKQWASP